MLTRYAELSDLPTVLVMYMAALAEIREHILEPDVEKCADEVLQSFSKAPCVLLEQDGDVFGFAGLKTLIAPYTSVPQLGEYMFYIRKDKRSVKAARKLSMAVQAVADKFKMPLYMAHMVFDSSVAIKDKFLRRWGYTPFCLGVSYGVKI